MLIIIKTEKEFNDIKKYLSSIGKVWRSKDGIGKREDLKGINGGIRYNETEMDYGHIADDGDCETICSTSRKAKLKYTNKKEYDKYFVARKYNKKSFTS